MQTPVQESLNGYINNGVGFRAVSTRDTEAHYVNLPRRCKNPKFVSV